MPHNFRELEAQMAPERLARAEIKAKEIMADMPWLRSVNRWV